MPHRAASLSRRSALLAFTLAVVLSLLFLLPPRPVAALNCPDGFQAYTILYYNNAQHTTVVGNCERTCTSDRCVGQVTQYSETLYMQCCYLTN